jgi:hypothetical protein
MYDHIPARLYRNILVETDSRKYRLRILEGEVSESQPYVHVERNRHSRLYGGENKAREAAEMLFRKFESVGWHVYSPALPRPLPIRRSEPLTYDLRRKDSTERRNMKRLRLLLRSREGAASEDWHLSERGIQEA